eukprot:820401-Pyramimonas_sp.AAC.1
MASRMHIMIACEAGASGIKQGAFWQPHSGPWRRLTCIRGHLSGCPMLRRPVGKGPNCRTGSSGGLILTCSCT